MNKTIFDGLILSGLVDEETIRKVRDEMRVQIQADILNANCGQNSDVPLSESAKRNELDAAYKAAGIKVIANGE